jgi:hypothetical protein
MPDADPRITRASADVQKHGWHVVKVMADESGPAFAYSIGLYETFKHPEVLLFGFELDLMHLIINNVGFEFRNGKRYGPDQQDDDILDDYDVEFKTVLPRFFDELVGTALDYYGGPVFRVLQCVLPDKAHRFPWDPECSEWLKENQRTFFEDRPTGRPSR